MQYVKDFFNEFGLYDYNSQGYTLDEGFVIEYDDIRYEEKNEVIYISRANVPYQFKKESKFHKKHLSVVSFKPESLLAFGKSKLSELEKIEDVELLRALDIGLKVKSLNLIGDSFSIDVFEDYQKAKIQISRDRYFKFYR